MRKKGLGLIIIAIAVLLGVLRLLNVVDNTVTVVLFVGTVIIFGGTSVKSKKTTEDAQEPGEQP